MKILFLDIDGPLIPGRAYTMPGQTKGIVKTFDPCAVGLINFWCKSRKWKLVLHSSWVQILGGEDTYLHCLSQGLNKDHFHKDAWCDEHENWRYTRVAKWLKEHPETTHYMILDDEPYKIDLFGKYPHPADISNHLILVDFEDGILIQTMKYLAGRDARHNPQL